MTYRAMLTMAAIAASAILGAPPAQAQTAADINRLNQAMQICNSPLGAGVPECAQLRGQLGGLGGAGALAGALAGQQRQQQQQQQQQPYNQLNAGAAQQAYVACVQRSGGNQMVVNACSLALQAQMAAGAGGYAGVPNNYSAGNVPPAPAPARPAAPYDPFAPPPPNGR